MIVEELSAGYWMTELDIAGWGRDHAALGTKAYTELTDHVYGPECRDPLLVRESMTDWSHLRVFEEASLPSETLIVPGGDTDIGRDTVLVVKDGHAQRLLDYR